MHLRHAAAILALATLTAAAQTKTPPRTWVDKDTGHRVWRLTDEPNSGAFYFNVNAYTPYHKQMVYNSPEGIRVLDLDTMKTKMLVPYIPPPPGVSESPMARFARGLHANELHAGIGHEAVEDPHRVGAAAHARHHAARQHARPLQHLRASLRAAPACPG